MRSYKILVVNILITAWLAMVNTLDIMAQPAVYPFSEKGKIGYKFSEDSIVIEPVYDYAEKFRPGHDWTVVGIGEWELLNNSISERQVKFTGKMGMIDSAGNVIINPNFDLVPEIHNEYAIVGKGKAEIIYRDFPDKKGFGFQGTLGVISREGKVIVPIEFNMIETVDHENMDFWFVRMNNPDSSFLYSRNFRITLPDSIEHVYDYFNGLARVKAGGKFGFIDTEGRTVIPFVYERARNFDKGLTLVKKNRNYFFIDTSGQIRNREEAEFDEVENFHEGYALVRVFDEYGYINKDSVFFKTPRFSEASSFFNDIAWVATVDSFGYVYTDGREDLVIKYDREKDRPWEIMTPPPEQLNVPDSIPCNCRDTLYFFKPMEYLDLKNMLTISLEAFRWGPYVYYHYPHMLPKVCAGEGTLTGRYIFNKEFLQHANPVWESFKEKVLFKIIGSEQMRRVAWDWIRPFYQASFQSMPGLHRQVYMDMILYLESYFNNYNLENTQEYLENHWDDFAYFHPDGSTSPYRKVSAFIDRLILVHQTMRLNEVKLWLKKVRQEMERW